MNLLKRVLACLTILATLFASMPAAIADTHTDTVVTDVVFNGVTYRNQTNFTWEELYPVPAGGIQWDGEPDFLYITYPDAADIEQVDGQGRYIRNQLSFFANMTGEIGGEFRDVEQLMASYGVRIIGYIAAAACYQVETVEDVSYAELVALQGRLNNEVLITGGSVLVQWLTSVTTYTATPFPGAVVNTQQNSDRTDDQSLWRGDPLDETQPRGRNWGMEFINAPSAWRYDAIMQPIQCAVIDAGMYNHVDLSFVRTFAPLSGTADDDHGTHVSGIIAAKHDDKGVSGVFHNASLVGVRDIGYDETTWDNIREVFPFSLCLSVSYALIIDREPTQPCVINISLGFAVRVEPHHTAEQKEQIERQREALVDWSNGVENAYIIHYTDQAHQLSTLLNRFRGPYGDFVICTSAGNDFAFSIDAGLMNVPAIISEPQDILNRIIVVGSIGLTQQGAPAHASSSNTGDRVDVMAPGVNIYSTVGTNEYDYLSGTSMASPHAAGVAAMIWSIDPTFTGEQVKQFLIDSRTNTIAPRSDDSFRTPGRAYPLLNARSAVDMARNEARKATLAGKVASLSGTALANAEISVYEDNVVIASCQSQTDGSYSLSVKPGVYRVRCHQAGYIAKSESMTVKAAEAAEISFILSPTTAAPGSVSGKLLNPLGQTIEDVQLKMTVSVNNIQNTTLSGTFNLPSMPAGSYLFTFTKQGYKTTIRNVTVFSNQNTDLGDILMDVDGVYMIMRQTNQASGVSFSFELQNAPGVSSFHIRHVKNGIIYIDTAVPLGGFTHNGNTIAYTLDDELIHGAELDILASGSGWSFHYNSVTASQSNMVRILTSNVP